jgi:hypothetical protein
MQNAKDSFYLAVRDRLAALDPARTVIVDGQARPAVLVAENEPAAATAALPNAFYLSWGVPQVVAGSESAAAPLMKLECRIAYFTAGALVGGVDRGRALAALDAELLRLISPPRTPKYDHARTPAAALGTTVFWGAPEFDDLEERDGELRRRARLLVFFFPEVDPS